MLEYSSGQIAYLTKVRTVEIRTAPIPPIGGKDVLVRVRRVGICGSDISYFTKGYTGVGAIKFPHVMGHELSGDIVATGDLVSHLAVGDRVVVEPGYSCGQCEHCLTGRYNLCTHMSFMSSAVAKEYKQGALAEFCVRPSHLVFKLPPEVSYDQGALMEPLSVAMHAVQRSGLLSGQSAAVLGSGPIAACILMVLISQGIIDVTMTDLVRQRLDFMTTVGAKRVLDVAELTPDQLQKAVLEQSVDAVFDTTCNEKAVNTGLVWLKKGGTLVLVGVPDHDYMLDLRTIFNKELTIRSSFRYANTFPRIIPLVASGVLKPERLISHRFPFNRVQEAFDLSAQKTGGVMKVLIEI